MRSFDTGFKDLASAITSFEALPFEEKQQVLYRFIKKIWITKNYEFRIEWAFSSPKPNAIQAQPQIR